MTKFFLQAIVALSLIFAAPTADASISLADQRVAVYDALGDVITDLQTEIDTLTAQRNALPDPAGADAQQFDLLSRQILSLTGRKRFAESTRSRVPYYSAAILDRIIVRYDLPVSLS